MPNESKSKPTAASPTENLKGSLFMVFAMLGYSTNDALMKSVGQSITLGQTLFVRGAFATVLLFALAAWLGQLRDPKPLLHRNIAWRTIGEMAGTVCFLTALFNMPIANATAILQAMPLALTATAAVIFREKVGLRRISAILIGFAGVLIIVRPGVEGFTLYSVLVLGAVGFNVLRDLATRAIPNSIPGVMISLVTAIAVTALGGVLTLFQGWAPMSAMALFKLAGASAFLVFGYYFIIAAMRIGDVGFVAPFRFTILLNAIALGYFLFNEIPDTLTLVGAALVVTTGIYTLYRERIVQRQTITPPPSR